MKTLTYVMPTLLAIGGMLATYGIVYGTMKTRLENLEGANRQAEVEKTDRDHRLSADEERLTRVEDAVNQLPEIRSDIKQILREVNRTLR